MKRYLSSLLLAILAVLLAGAGTLSLTAWKPAQDVTATGTTEAPFLITRPGLFDLYGDGEVVRVEVTAQSPDQHVWVALGSFQDVSAWVESHSYEEIYGLQNLKTLKMEPHLLGGESPQSGEDPEQAQSAGEIEESQSGEAAVNPIVSDMWELERDAVGSLQMAISKDQMDKTMLVATDGVAPAPSVTLSWDTPQQNYAALFLFSFTALFALLAVFAGLMAWRQQRRRAVTRARLQSQITADSTETTMIPAVTESGEATIVEVEPEEVASTPEPPEPTADREFAPVDITSTEQETDNAEHESSPDDTVAEEPHEEEAAVPEEPEDARGDRFLDKTQKLTTDSGLINLTALQGGAKFPTRRALREAQARGVETLVIEGREFVTSTGSLPVQGEESAKLSEKTALLGKRSMRSTEAQPSGEAEDNE